jgi:hypothetical protein
MENSSDTAIYPQHHHLVLDDAMSATPNDGDVYPILLDGRGMG